MFTLDQVVPWGRSFDEYQRMFAMTNSDLEGTILGCGDGPASFNAEATRRGARVTSVDPIYTWNVGQIWDRIAASSEEIIEQTRANTDEFVWTTIRSIEELRRLRMGAMSDFLRDFTAGKAEGRYLDAELPNLPFADESFDLGLSSHFLFLYTAQLGQEFHRAAVQELCRVCREVRIFPLLELGARPSDLVGVIVDDRTDLGFRVSIETVPYEFQRGGNQMMRIRRAQPADT